MTRYHVETAALEDTYTADSPEIAVQAFFRQHGNMVGPGVKVRVSVIDFIGEFSQETRVIRHPRQTKPDSPHGYAKTDPQPAP